jgi:ubiquinone/menaquinone biosynthesis C-methylase UbiE
VAREVRHPIFARIYDRGVRDADKRGGEEHRRELLGGLAGRVIEVGAGNGINFPHYPAEVSEVVAIEPEDYLRTRAEEAAAKSQVAVRVLDGLADSVPADDGSFDAAVVSLMLCSVPDQERALGELRRVLRPGGELRFYEHVLANSESFARAQRLAAPVWRRVSGGCNLNRDTGAAIERAGFRIERCRRFPFRPCFVAALAAPHILGVARKP